MCFVCDVALQDHLRRFTALKPNALNKGAEYRSFNLTAYAKIDFRTYSKRLKRSSSGNRRTYTVEFTDAKYSACDIWGGKLSKNSNPKIITTQKLCVDVSGCKCSRCLPIIAASSGGADTGSSSSDQYISDDGDDEMDGSGTGSGPGSDTGGDTRSGTGSDGADSGDEPDTEYSVTGEDDGTSEESSDNNSPRPTKKRKHSS